jgi:hypothetical protein
MLQVKLAAFSSRLHYNEVEMKSAAEASGALSDNTVALRG